VVTGRAWNGCGAGGGGKPVSGVRRTARLHPRRRVQFNPQKSEIIMGIGSVVGLLTGTGDVKSPGIGKVGNDYLGLINAYQRSVPGLYNQQAEYQPKYADLA